MLKIAGWEPLARSVLRMGNGIGCSGLLCPGSGAAGVMRWFSFSRIRWSAGTGSGSASSGPDYLKPSVIAEEDPLSALSRASHALPDPLATTVFPCM